MNKKLIIGILIVGILLYSYVRGAAADSRTNKRGLLVSVGGRYRVQAGYNLRDTRDTSAVLNYSDADDVYEVQSFLQIIVAGVSHTAALVRFVDATGVVIPGWQWVVAIDGFTEKVK